MNRVKIVDYSIKYKDLPDSWTLTLTEETGRYYRFGPYKNRQTALIAALDILTQSSDDVWGIFDHEMPSMQLDRN